MVKQDKKSNRLLYMQFLCVPKISQKGWQFSPVECVLKNV